MTFLALHERNLCCYQWLEVVRNLVSRPRAIARPGRGPPPGIFHGPGRFAETASSGIALIDHASRRPTHR